MKTKIKDLKHATVLYEQGILVPMKSVLVDGNGDERVFLGFTLLKDQMITLTDIGCSVKAWRCLDLLDYAFHIKPKTKIMKFESYLLFWKDGAITINSCELKLCEVVKTEKIVREIEVECDDE